MPVMRARTHLMAVAVIGLSLAGCRPSEPLDVRRTPTGKIGGAPTPPEKTPGEKIAEKMQERAATSKPHEQLYVIKDPGSDGWKPEQSIAEKQNLGDIIDSGLAKLEPAFADVKVEFSNGGDLLQVSPQFRFQDLKHFNIEYALPETEGDLNRLLADGRERAKWEDQKLTMLPPFEKSAPAPKFDRAGIENFVRRMPADGFSYFQTGAKTWGNLVRALEDPANGFETTTEERKFTVKGEERPFLRLVAKSVSGPKTELEVLVDTKRNVPVTFRSTQVAKDGKKRQLWWTADWAFNGKHEQKWFVIPKKK